MNEDDPNRELPNTIDPHPERTHAKKEIKLLMAIRQMIGVGLSRNFFAITNYRLIIKDIDDKIKEYQTIIDSSNK